MMLYGTMVYLLDCDKVLMMKKEIRENDPNSGYYTLPGGKLEQNEKGHNAFGRLESAVREVIDETGLKLLDPITLRGTILFDNKGRTFDNWPNPDNYFVYIFEANNYEGKLKPFSDEGIPLWVNRKDIPNLSKNPGDMKLYEWLRNPSYFIGVIRHNGNELDEENTWIDFF